MGESSKVKFEQSLEDLRHALSFEPKAKEDLFFFGGIAKAFETAMEYTWKYFRSEAISAGFDVPSPREAIKLAANLGMIEDLEEWLGLLKTRNIAVHDYIGFPREEYLAQIKLFAQLSKKIRAPRG
jgi:nucleotidyltransferase substrate binding protein (TIGR01987 family)